MNTEKKLPSSCKRTVYLSDEIWKKAVNAGKELNISTSKVLAYLVLEAAHLLTAPSIRGLNKTFTTTKPDQTNISPIP